MNLLPVSDAVDGEEVMVAVSDKDGLLRQQIDELVLNITAQNATEDDTYETITRNLGGNIR